MLALSGVTPRGCTEPYLGEGCNPCHRHIAQLTCPAAAINNERVVRLSLAIAKEPDKRYISY
jgi:hypothetical protein